MTPSVAVPPAVQVPEDLKIPKDMYQHAIPRFILRQFGARLDLLLSSQLSDKQHAWITSKKSPLVHLYKVSTGQLSVERVGSIYGEMNLYRNLKESQDVDYLEHKLAHLENDASFVIKAIHAGIPSGSIALSRAELATLRKFIFLMHYRSVAASASYFHEDNPLNAPLADWIKKFKQTRELQTEVDVWQAGLKYYLDTPHHEIVAAGESLRDRYGDHRLYEMLRKRFDPDIEGWYAIDYEGQANYFFLGVWEAAEGNEFILSGNSFGLWEGLIYGSPGAHRIYVVSPRIALVLRRTYFHNPHSNDPSIVYSTLINVAISRTEVTHAQDFLKDVDPEDPAMIAMARNAYRVSPQAQKDSFAFRYTKLSAQETYSVNEVILLNANTEQNGSITFSSRQAMINTLESYMASHNTYLGGKKELLRPLLTKLLQNKNKKLKKPILPTLESQDLSLDASDADRLLSMFLRSLALSRMNFLPTILGHTSSTTWRPTCRPPTPFLSEYDEFKTMRSRG